MKASQTKKFKMYFYEEIAMIEEIIGLIKYKDKKKGSCFLVNSEYVFTARHVVYDKTTGQIIKNIICVLKNKSLNINGTVIYDDDKNDFAIVKLEKQVEGNFYRISRDVIEDGDLWKSGGYPSNSKDRLFPHGQVVINVNREYELEIYNEENGANWSGISGAPVIIENEIVGVVIDQEGGGNVKVVLKIASMEDITENMNEDLLQDIYIGYHPLLYERLERVSEGCKNIFYSSSDCWKNGEINYYIFNEGKKSITDLSDNINLLIHDYGVDLVTEDEFNRSNSLKKREIEEKINRKKKHTKNLIKENNQLVHILLWMLIEGNFKYVRIGSYIIDIDNSISRDVYFNDKDKSINIVLSSGYLDSSIVDIFQDCVDQLENYLDDNIKGKNIFIRDELVIKSLKYTVQNKISSNKLKEIIEEGKSLNIVLLVGFDYSKLLSLPESNENKLCYLKSYVDGFEGDFEKIIDRSNRVKGLNIKWVFLPFDDVNKFFIDFKERYL